MEATIYSYAHKKFYLLLIYHLPHLMKNAQLNEVPIHALIDKVLKNCCKLKKTKFSK